MVPACLKLAMVVESFQVKAEKRSSVDKKTKNTIKSLFDKNNTRTRVSAVFEFSSMLVELPISIQSNFFKQY